MSRSVEQGVEKTIRPLVNELALLREALQKNLDDDWWKGDEHDQSDDEPDNGNVF